MRYLFNRLYRGEINRLVIVAAPSGAGKSTFLENSAAMLDAAVLPTGLEDFHELARQHTTIRDLRKSSIRRFDNLCMHVDLSRPIKKLNRLAGARQRLLASLTARVYSQWRDLAVYINRASEVHIVTMFVRREAHYRRWVERAERRQVVLKPQSVLSVINSDLTNGSELHRKAYDAWRQYVAALGTQSSHVVDANSSEYTFLSRAEFDHEIDFGYKEHETILRMDQQQQTPQAVPVEEFQRPLRRAA